MEKTLSRIKENAEKYKYFVVFLLIGICFMILSVPSGEKNIEITQNEQINEFDILEVESKLEDILSKINKVGEVSVMLTIESSIKNVYATNKTENLSENDNQMSKNTQSEFVLISPINGSEQPVKIYDIYPEFKGALIVCEGADDPEVSLQILKAVRSLCGISSEKITISKMKE